MRSFLLTLATVALLATIPALWIGAHLAAYTGMFMLFPIPVLVCVGIMSIALHYSEVSKDLTAYADSLDNLAKQIKQDL